VLLQLFEYYLEMTQLVGGALLLSRKTALPGAGAVFASDN
jgi:hypothetical protein